MKWIISILVIIYLSALFGVSCSDAKNACVELKSPSKVELKHSHSQDEDDNCSPFQWLSSNFIYQV